jgi:hypothetical protein
MGKRDGLRLEVSQASRVSVGGQLHSEWEIRTGEDRTLAGWVRGVPSTATGEREYVPIALDRRGRRVYLSPCFGRDGNVHAVAAIMDRSVSL